MQSTEAEIGHTDTQRLVPGKAFPPTRVGEAISADLLEFGAEPTWAIPCSCGHHERHGERILAG